MESATESKKVAPRRRELLVEPTYGWGEVALRRPTIAKSGSSGVTRSTLSKTRRTSNFNALARWKKPGTTSHGPSSRIFFGRHSPISSPAGWGVDVVCGRFPLHLFRARLQLSGTWRFLFQSLKRALREPTLLRTDRRRMARKPPRKPAPCAFRF